MVALPWRAVRGPAMRWKFERGATEIGVELGLFNGGGMESYV